MRESRLRVHARVSGPRLVRASCVGTVRESRPHVVADLPIRITGGPHRCGDPSLVEVDAANAA